MKIIFFTVRFLTLEEFKAAAKASSTTTSEQFQNHRDELLEERGVPRDERSLGLRKPMDGTLDTSRNVYQ